tara:strand:+ start:626 stop:799 length:174 start_codon:yes stop_codon:yes gene_type:complete
MRTFKKEGFMKLKKSDNTEYCDKLLSDGWTEVGSKVVEASAKKTTSKKSKPKKEESE